VNFDTSKFQAAQAAGHFQRGDICGFGKATGFKQGSRHGVFAFDNAAFKEEVPTLPVRDFHQKSPPEVLERECAVAGDPSKCAVDMGIFSFGPRWVGSFLDFAFSPRPVDAPADATTILSAVEHSELFFDFYLECVTASLPAQSSEAFVARMAANGTKLGKGELELMHQCLAPLELRGALASDAMFLHFGTITEYPASSSMAVQNSMWPIYIPADAAAEAKASAVAAVASGDGAGDGIFRINCSEAGEGVVAQRAGACAAAAPPVASMAWLESCSESTIWLPARGFNMVVGVQGLQLSSSTALPHGMCLDGRHWSVEGAPGFCVAPYGMDDTFKAQKARSSVVFCGLSIDQWLGERGLAAEDAWGAPEASDLWTAKLFCPRGDLAPADYTAKLVGYWDAQYFDKAWFASAPRLSLQQLNELDSAVERDTRRIQFRS